MPRRVDNVPSASRNRAARNRRMELCVRKHARRASGSTGARCSGLLEHEEKGGGERSRPLRRGGDPVNWQPCLMTMLINIFETSAMLARGMLYESDRSAGLA